MEEIEECEEKVNIMDLLLPELSEDRKDYVLYGENVQLSSQFDKSTVSSVTSRNIQEKGVRIKNEYELKESKRKISDTLVLPPSKIKKEIFQEEELSCHGSSQDDNSCNNSDFLELTNILNENGQSVYEKEKETIPNEEIHLDNKLDEQHSTVRVLRSRRLSLPVHQSESLNKCDLCKYVFGVSTTFLDHMKICNNPSNICRTILMSVIDAAVTEKIVEDNEMVDSCTLYRFVCCNQIFTTFSEFNAHKLSRHDIQPLVCGLCSCAFTTAQDLYKHYSAQHFPGLNMHLIFYTPEEYQKNTEECTAKEQGILCQCPVCTRKHSNDNSDKSTVSRPYECKICKMRFAYRIRLKKHEATHVGLKTHPCNICAMSFTRRIPSKYRRMHS